jgi:hypothetical protein
MLSTDLKRLHETVEGWFNGTVAFTSESAMTFKRDLGLCAARAALMEIGVDVSVLDAAAEAAKPGSNVVLLPGARWLRKPLGEVS